MPTEQYTTNVIAYLTDLMHTARRNAAEVARCDKDDPMLTYFAGLADGIETALESLQQLVPTTPFTELN